MPSIRVGFGTDLNITGGLTGIGTTNPAVQLDIPGQIRSENTAGSGGVSTFREYQGFSQVEAKITNNVTIDNESGGPYSSLSGEIKITGETTVSSGSTVEVGKTKTLTVTDRFAVPLGETNNRDNTPEAGTTRFNQDFGTLEFFDGVNWKTVNSYARPDGAGRMLIGGNGDQTIHTGLIQTVSIPALGEFTTFGDLSQARDGVGGGGNGTRAVFCGGATNPGGGNTTVDTIDYNTIASGGTGIDFGNLTGQATRYPAVCSSSTRVTTAVADGSIFYVQTSTLGNALDGGNIFDTSIVRLMAGAQSPTRGYHFGGFQSPGNANQISSFSLASMGKAIRFGDLLNGASTYLDHALSNTTRAVLASETTTNSKHIAYINMTTEGVASYFGDLSSAGRGQASSTQVRGVIAHRASPGDNVTEYITIPTGGNGVSFGELSTPQNSGGCTSDSHGGLGGF
jgi:hypothetical protein